MFRSESKSWRRRRQEQRAPSGLTTQNDHAGRKTSLERAYNMVGDSCNAAAVRQHIRDVTVNLTTTYLIDIFHTHRETLTSLYLDVYRIL